MSEPKLKFFDERKTPIDMLVLHCSALSGAEMFEVFNAQKVSAHYIIDENGQVLNGVDEEKCAWHAGKSFWRGREGLNSCSVGIEITSPSLGQEPYSEKQMSALITLCQKIITKYKIPAFNVVGHSDIAPLRKADPGCAFPWERLAQEGIGWWPKGKEATSSTAADIKELLSSIGYDTRDDEVLKASAYAFCRRFLPQYVEKVDDVSYLIEHVLPDNFDFMQEDIFLKTLFSTEVFSKL